MKKTRHIAVAVTAATVTFGVASARAQDADTSSVSDGAPADEQTASWADFAEAAQDEKIFNTRIYGYIDSYFEQVANTPAGVGTNGETLFEPNPYEFDVLNLNLMVQGTIYGTYRYFLNLAGPGAGGVTGDEPLAIRNAWVEAPLIGSKLQLRAGKTYRRFGLYNEILDAVPTFIGIEAPELFDKDHLMLTRTTNLMLHGRAAITEEAHLSYSLTTGNDERTRKAVPIGGDLQLGLFGVLRLGASFYWTGGDAEPSRDVGDGSPRGGVVNWMARDEYYVLGGYGALDWQGLIVQAAFWRAQHDATRDPDKTRQLANANLNSRQLQRFFAGGDPMGAVNEDASYAVQTFYLRAGYELPFFETIQLIPYAQVDYFENPETIAEKDFGGDNEAGLSDDGRFWKLTVGAVFRPVPQVALKVDGSAHVQKFNNETVFYPEIRTSLSYLWELEL